MTKTTQYQRMRSRPSESSTKRSNRGLLKTIVQAPTEFAKKLFGSLLAKGNRPSTYGRRSSQRLGVVMSMGEILEDRRLMSVNPEAAPFELSASVTDALQRSVVTKAQFSELIVGGNASINDSVFQGFITAEKDASDAIAMQVADKDKLDRLNAIALVDDEAIRELAETTVANRAQAAANSAQRSVSDAALFSVLGEKAGDATNASAASGSGGDFDVAFMEPATLDQFHALREAEHALDLATTGHSELVGALQPIVDRLNTALAAAEKSFDPIAELVNSRGVAIPEWHGMPEILGDNFGREVGLVMLLLGPAQETLKDVPTFYALRSRLFTNVIAVAQAYGPAQAAVTQLNASAAEVAAAQLVVDQARSALADETAAELVADNAEIEVLQVLQYSLDVEQQRLENDYQGLLAQHTALAARRDNTASQFAAQEGKLHFDEQLVEKTTVVLVDATTALEGHIERIKAQSQIPLPIGPIDPRIATPLEDNLARIGTTEQLYQADGLYLPSDFGNTFEPVDDRTFAVAAAKELSIVREVAEWNLDNGYPFDANAVASTFTFSVFNTNDVPIPQAQNYGGGPRTTIEGAGLVELYSSELGLTIDAFGALTATRPGGVGDTVGFALRDDDDNALELATTVEWAGAFPTVLQYGFHNQPALGEIVVQPGLHTYDIPRAAQWWQIQTTDGRLIRFVDFTIKQEPPARNRIRDLNEQGERLLTVSHAISFLSSQVTTLDAAGRLPLSLSHLPAALAEATTTLAHAVAEFERTENAFNSIPWDRLTAASRDVLFPTPGYEHNLGISVVTTDGPALLLAFRNLGIDRPLVVLDRGAGVYSRVTPTIDPETEMCTATVVIDRTAPTGSYPLRFIDADAADRLFGSVDLPWNYSAGSFDLEGVLPAFEPTSYPRDDGVTPIAELFQSAVIAQGKTAALANAASDRFHAADGMERAFRPVGEFDGQSNKNIEDRQKNALLDALNSEFPALRIVTANDLDDAFYVLWPHWQPELKPQVKSANRWDEYTYEHSKAGDRDSLSAAAGTYNSSFQTMVAMAFDAVAAARQGDHRRASELRGQMEAAYGAGTSTLAHIGVVYPDVTTLLSACATTLELHPNAIANSYADANRHVSNRIWNDFYNPNAAGGDGNTSRGPSPEEQARRDQQRQANFESMLSTVSYLATQGRAIASNHAGIPVRMA